VSLLPRRTGDCPDCGGDIFFRACGGMGGRRSSHRCRCSWPPMQRVQWAFKWVAWLLACQMGQSDVRHHPREWA
jgi:hypothetical protein